MRFVLPSAVFCVVALRGAKAVGVDTDKTDKWAYAPSSGCASGAGARCGPAEWSTITGFESCAQKGTQSPIDMQLGSADAMPSQGFKLLTSGTCSLASFVLNEHTVEVDVMKTCKDTYSVEFRGKQYHLLQLHYHSPSENTWDGGYFAMEAHYVHKSDDNEYVVLATMIGVGPPGDSANFLEKVLDATPTPNNGDDNFHTEKKTIDLNVYNFMPASVSSTQYFFNGSMTTPPCNPGPTHWVMATEPVYVEQSTVDRYRALINSNPNNQLSPFGTIVGNGADSPPVFNSLAGSVDWDTSLGSNSRPLQPLTGSDNPTRKLYKLGSPPSDVSTTVIIVLIALVGLGAVAFFFLKGQQNPTKAREQNDPIYSVLDGA